MDSKTFLNIIGLSGALAVGLGAFGAHGLEGEIPPARLETYQTANFYHFIHTLVLLGVFVMIDQRGWNPKLLWAARSIGIGHLLFSGSLYLLATRGLLGLEQASWLGIITPFGGVAFIVGWILLAFSAKPKS